MFIKYKINQEKERRHCFPTIYSNKEDNLIVLQTAFIWSTVQTTEAWLNTKTSSLGSVFLPEPSLLSRVLNCQISWPLPKHGHHRAIPAALRAYSGSGVTCGPPSSPSHSSTTKGTQVHVNTITWNQSKKRVCSTNSELLPTPFKSATHWVYLREIKSYELPVMK